ncbi:MAG: hypothetical protein NTV52_31790 [Acidobacteria bacterium]|nr:hypothetical protein [Acidobacteriota bacterium]
MRWVLFAAFVLSPLGAEDQLPSGIVRGKITEPVTVGLGGTFLLTDEVGRVLRCAFDARTWFESLRVRVSLEAFTPQDPVEVLVDRQPERGCYARTVRLAEPNAPATNSRRPVYRSVTEHLYPRGELVFAAVVTELTAEVVVLRTRTEAARRFRLRPDTRFLENGVVSERANLSVNQRVFVRAGKSVEGALEVYQMIWGGILPGK